MEIPKDDGWNIDNSKQLSPFPLHRLKRVDKPTTVVTDNVQRFDLTNEALMRSFRGEFGPAVQEKAKYFGNRCPLSVANTDMLSRILSCRADQIADKKAPIPEDPGILSNHIKNLGYFLGADIVGICKFPKYAAYKCDFMGNPVEIDFKNAIVIVKRKEHNTVAASTGADWMGDPISMRSYVHVAFMAEIIAGYIKKLGFPASPQSMAGDAVGKPIGDTSFYQVAMGSLLLWAGIGEISRTHMIVNPFLGPSFKASAILTDLPLEPDKPIDFGLQEFCQQCTICAEACPSKAIPFGDKVIYNGYETWRIDERKCMSFLLLNKKGSTCNMCTKVCPWTRPTTRFHDTVRWAVSRSRLARKIAIKWDSTFGRGKSEGEKWWFDLCYDENGNVKISNQNG